LRGTVQGEQVSLPPLDNPADISGKVPELDPFEKRVGVAVVGLGRLALTQILPGFAHKPACPAHRARQRRAGQGAHHRRAIPRAGEKHLRLYKF
jgi:transposase